MIQLDDIHKTYGTGAASVEVLKGVSLRLERGEMCAIMGASGSGKSTLLNLLGLLDRPTSGRYRLDDIEVQSSDADELADLRNHKIGFVFQAYNLIPVMTAYENAAFVLDLQNVSKGDIHHRVMET